MLISYACYRTRNISITTFNFLVLSIIVLIDIWYYLPSQIKKHTMDILYSFQRAQKCQKKIDTDWN